MFNKKPINLFKKAQKKKKQNEINNRIKNTNAATA